MRTITITSKEYAERYGCSQRFVNQKLSDGIGMPYMVSYRKAGGTWLVEVLVSWWDDGCPF